MLPLLNWPKLEVPVIVGWYLDEAYGVLMPSDVWNKPLSDIDDKIKRYSPRNFEGWNLACQDMIAHGMAEGRAVSLMFWIHLAESDHKLSIDSDATSPMKKLMTRFGDPDVMIITGHLNNFMALLQFGTTWPHMLYNHGNLMPISGPMFHHILQSLTDFDTTGFSKLQLKTYIETLMNEAEEGERPVENLEPDHLRIISMVVGRM
tara:strand:- start:1241 stop:1855 length:615 start_codon:yes stop_codon:yes gene_type:complete